MRWIEAAIAAPVWTTMICYYLEEDYGHLMTEPLFEKRNRVGARGNVFSYAMPWDEILQGLQDLSNKGAVGPPHPPEFLAHMVRVHVKVNAVNVAKRLKEAKVRPHVVLKLGMLLIDSGAWHTVTQTGV